MYNYNYKELFHYGMPKRSGRYPYGSGDRPYQSSGGVSSKITSKPSRMTFKEKKAAKKASAQKAEEEKKKREEQEATRRHEENRERVLKEGTATELKEYASELSNAEFEAALKRLELNRRLNSYTKSEIQTTFDKVDKFMSKANKVNNWASTTINAYENSQKLMKMFDQLTKQAQQQAEKEAKKKTS